MNLIRKTYDTTEVQITSFQSSKGITEYHIFFQQTNCLEDFHTQLQHIQDVYARSVEELPGNPVAIFRRYFLSDVTNQTDELMERERLSPYCALSIVQQAPMHCGLGCRLVYRHRCCQMGCLRRVTVHTASF